MSQSKQAAERVTDEEIVEVLLECAEIARKPGYTLGAWATPVAERMARELQALRAAATAVMRGLDGENGPGLDECEALRALLGMEPV